MYYTCIFCDTVCCWCKMMDSKNVDCKHNWRPQEKRGELQKAAFRLSLCVIFQSVTNPSMYVRTCSNSIFIVAHMYADLNVFGKFQKWKCDFFRRLKWTAMCSCTVRTVKKNFKDFYTLIPRITAIFFFTNCAFGG